MSRDWRLYLADARHCAEKVVRYTEALSREAFFEDERTLDAVLRNLELLGEALKYLPEEVRRQHPGIAWRDIIGFRNVLAHVYFDLDRDILWDVIRKEVPLLLDTLVRLEAEY